MAVVIKTQIQETRITLVMNSLKLCHSEDTLDHEMR